MSKAFTLTSMIPRISSVTKTESAPKASASSKRSGSQSFTSRSLRSASAASSRGRAVSRNWVGMVSAAGVLAIVFGLGFYIYTINASASKGYDFKKQQAVVDELAETQKRLMIEQAAMGSIVKVNDVASTAGMVPVTGEEFLVANQISKR